MADEPTVPVVTPVIETGEQLVDPLIQHTERITRIEEQQAQHAERLAREMSDLESRLQNATGEQARAIAERLDMIEARMGEIANKSAEEVEEVPEEGVDLAVEEVESSPKPPEKVRRGMKYRRKAKKQAKK